MNILTTYHSIRNILLGLLVGIMLSHIALSQEPPSPPEPLQRDLESLYLAWEPNPEPNLTNYTVWVGTNSSVVEFTYVDDEDGLEKTSSLNTGTNYYRQIFTGTIAGVRVNELAAGGTYYFAVTAGNDRGQRSDFSTEVVSTLATELPPSRPSGINVVKIPVYTLTVAYSDDPGEWSTNRVFQLVIDTDKPHQFFKVDHSVELMDAWRLP